MKKTYDLIYGIIIGLVLCGVGLFLWPNMESETPHQLLRTLTLQTCVGIVRILLLLWALWILDGKLHAKIGENSYACAAVYLGILAAITVSMRLL